MAGSLTLTLTVALLLAASAAYAGGLEHTAVAALKDLRQLPHAAEWEYSGFIVQRNGVYLYTMFPRTDQSHDSVQVIVWPYLQPGDRLVGIYHNHPCYASTHYNHYFSFQDLMVGRVYETAAFMLDNCTGEVHEFDYRRDRIKDAGEEKIVVLSNGTTRHVVLTPGRIVGNIGITSPNLDTESTNHHGII